MANRQLFVRLMSQLDVRAVSGIDIGGARAPATAPVLPPDGQSIAFVTALPVAIKKIAVTGGVPTTICEGCGPLGWMSWDDQGIVFAQAGSDSNMPVAFAGDRLNRGSNRVMRVSAQGGAPEPLFEVTGGFPWGVQMLPGGDAVLYTLLTRGGFEGAAFQAGEWDKAQIVVQSLKSDQRKTLVDGATAARYLPSGHIVYTRGGVLFAQRFDLRRLQVIGEGVPVVEGVRRALFLGNNGTGTAYYDVSVTGTLAYVPGPLSTAFRTDLAILDQRSGVTRLKLPPG